MQPATIQATSTNGTVLNLSYGYSSPNNGNVASITNNLNNDRSQSFTYDYLNRILTAQSQANSGQYCWGQTFGYDATYWTNLTSISVSKCSATTLSLTVNSQNRVTNSGFSYDDAGNLTNDGSLSYTWDAANRLTATGGVTYTYDGDGQRVKDTYRLFGPTGGGDLLWWTDVNGSYPSNFIYFAGLRIAKVDPYGAVHYLYGDHLGSGRVMTNSSGIVEQESDYYPFGGERVITDTLQDPNTRYWKENRFKFTGMWRDWESSNDHTMFRKYPSNLGRWLSPDPMAGDILNPQSLNRYSYVVNNPTNFTDPLGLTGWSGDWPWPLPDDPFDPYGPPNPCRNIGYFVSHAECAGQPDPFDNGPWIPFPPPGGGGGGGDGGTAPGAGGGPMPGNAQDPPSTTIPFPPPGTTGPATITVVLQNALRTCMLIPQCRAVVIAGTVLAAAAVTVYTIHQTKGGWQRIVPSWAEGERPLPGESASEFADRLCKQHYPPDGVGCGKGPDSERSKIRKWARDKFGI